MNVNSAHCIHPSADLSVRKRWRKRFKPTEPQYSSRRNDIQITKPVSLHKLKVNSWWTVKSTPPKRQVGRSIRLRGATPHTSRSPD
jgi:hypothetical protein